MKIPILVQSENGNGFRAEILPATTFCGEGPTPKEAVENLRGLIQTRIDEGAEIGYLEFADNANPWLELIGVYKHDPYLSDYKQAIAEHRRQVEEDPDRL